MVLGNWGIQHLLIPGQEILCLVGMECYTAQEKKCTIMIIKQTTLNAEKH